MPSITSPVVGGKLTKANFLQGARRAGATFKSSVSEVETDLRALEAVLQQQAQILEEKMKVAFVSAGHGFRGGSTWSPLKASTLRKHRREGWSGLPLLASGKLRDSISGKMSGLHKKGGAWVYSISVVAGEHYGRYHATGYINHLTGRPVPARPPVEFTQSDIEQLAKAIRGAFGGKAL